MISLNGAWELYYRLEDGPLPDDLSAFRQGAQRIPAQVPGNVELDLVHAGVEPDPFYADHLYKFRKYEFYSWQFERTFAMPQRGDARWALTFEGLNTFARVYINGTLVGETRNALIAHTMDVTDALRYGQENHIAVRIRSAINEARGMDFPAMLRQDEYAVLRMPPSSFGWDIMGRFVSAGMWRGVHLASVPATRLADTYYATTHLTGIGAELLVKYHYHTDAPILDGFVIRVKGVCGDHMFEKAVPAPFVSGSLTIQVPDARLWWPRGYGQAHLYDVTMTLEHNGQVLAQKEERIGIRVIELEHVMKPGDDGAFKISVNHVPILCKGSNWVPLDALHSRDAQRLQAGHDLLHDIGCNIVRCWGGNVYEDHAFFDLCDERGILVWQDFAMACAVYSPDAAFAAQIEEEAAHVVRKLRNHPSILLWAGDNEVDEGLSALYLPCDNSRYNALTREVLPRVVRMHDPYRVFLPSSPYIPDGIARYQVPEQHNWGARAYFKDDFYKHTTAHFVSECGYHGCPAVASLKQYIPPEHLQQWLNNPIWDAHNTDYLPFGARGYNRIQLMHDQVDLLFGQVPTNLIDFARLSQISQAEAKKFFIERTRIKKWRRTGIIWWNLLDGWPQISDAVVDYYYAKKLAYHYIRRVQQPIAVMMDELTDWSHAVVLGNDSRDTKEVAYRVWDGDTGQTYLEGTALSPANENILLGHIRELAGRQILYLITWQVDGQTFGNHYISGYPTYEAARMLNWVDKIAALPQPFVWEV
ncbi:MAG: glycoside hydrolase family 2 protein [Christensenellales bacterium]|jgi:beta-mannosidase